jgi:lipopolysaccharide export system permease protein
VRLSAILSVYIGRQFLMSFLALLLVFLGLILVFDTVELLRRTASRPEVTFDIVVQMALLKLPHLSQKVFPFSALFGAMVVFWRLTRSHELVVTRGAGVSAWQFLLPVLILSAFLGLLNISLVNPLASISLTHFERLEGIMLKGQNSTLAISDSGLWLRQGDRKGQSVIHAARVSQQGSDVELSQIIVFVYEGTEQFSYRIDADEARLEGGFWHLTNVWIYVPELPARFEDEHWLETDLTLAKIQDSFAPPETMSFWALPQFIETLEAAGFSATRHRLHWHALLASPLLMCAMIFIAATFTLRHARRGGTTFVIGASVLTGFLLYFFQNVVLALGLSESIPVALAAWTPSGIASLLGVAALLHLEDG